ncbi:MAG: hypothetical protein RIT81_44660 [Deltaproteobacteria bacterium]
MRRCGVFLLLAFGCSSSDEVTRRPTEVEVFTHTTATEQTGLATGEYTTPALTYGSIPVEAKFEHVLNFRVTPMLPPHREALRTNGPLILIADDGDALVFSPLDHFFVSLVWFEDGAIHYGIEGEVDTVPAGMTHRFVMVTGYGVNATAEAWGAHLRADRGTTAPDRYADRGLSHLGYWTDNGAYYYYDTEPGMNEEDTMLAVKEEADRIGVPYGYLQLDSWWYFKAPGSGLNPWGGVTSWTPQPEMFPSGLESFQQRLGLPLILHNRWFAVENDYRDDYDFVDDEGPMMALPADRAVFDALMDDAVRWGAFTYEQDWLIPQYWGVPHLRNGVGKAARWMNDIDEAARDKGLTTQITMPGASHLMDVVDRPSVTTIRTSIDYSAEASKAGFWPQFHTVNMLAGALGVWPFKDNFHSAEKWGEAEALISILSAGMVGVGDGLGRTKVDLVMATARADGLLLKPDRPATPIDAMFLEHERPYITSTWSDRPGVGRWHYVAAYHIDRTDEDQVALDDLFAAFGYDGIPLAKMFVLPEKITSWGLSLSELRAEDERMVAYDWRAKTARVVESVSLPATSSPYDHSYHVLAPILDGDWALIGETDKFVTVADERFESIVPNGDSLGVEVVGVAGEALTIAAFDADAEQIMTRDVTIDAEGRGRVTFTR